MNELGQSILLCLSQVEFERSRRAANGSLALRVREVKRYQHARFAVTYADLLADRYTAGAARFFLEDLYGPKDFSERDAQFARVIPGLVRLFPAELCETVLSLARLHALSERLDTEMGLAMDGPGLDGPSYGQAWRQVGRSDDRNAQIALMQEVGTALERHTRRPLLRQSLRLMRGPASAAGFGALQAFLERGFDTFRALRDAKGFLNTIATRERALALRLFNEY